MAGTCTSSQSGHRNPCIGDCLSSTTSELDAADITVWFLAVTFNGFLIDSKESKDSIVMIVLSVSYGDLSQHMARLCWCHVPDCRSETTA